MKISCGSFYGFLMHTFSELYVTITMLTSNFSVVKVMCDTRILFSDEFGLTYLRMVQISSQPLTGSEIQSKIVKLRKHKSESRDLRS